MAHYLSCHPAISQFLMADISFNIACKELKIAQIAQLNQLFQLLYLVHIYGHSFYELSRMLIRKNVNNDGSKDSPISDQNVYLFDTFFQTWPLEFTPIFRLSNQNC